MPRRGGAILSKSERGAVDSVVLFYLVPGGAGAVLRAEPAVVADEFGSESYRRRRALFKRGAVGTGAGANRFLADGAVLHDAVLRVEFFGAGEGSALHSDFFPKLFRRAHRRGIVRHILPRVDARQTTARGALRGRRKRPISHAKLFDDARRLRTMFGGRVKEKGRNGFWRNGFQRTWVDE